MTLKVKVNEPYFQYQWKVSQDACLVQIWWHQPTSTLSYRADKPNFLEFWVKMANMTFKVKVNDLHFLYHKGVSNPWCMFGANFVIPAQILDKLLWQDKVYRRTLLENFISAAMKQAAPHTCFFYLVFFTDVFGEFDISCHEASCTKYLLLLSYLLHIG